MASTRTMSKRTPQDVPTGGNPAENTLNFKVIFEGPSQDRGNMEAPPPTTPTTPTTPDTPIYLPFIRRVPKMRHPDLKSSKAHYNHKELCYHLNIKPSTLHTLFSILGKHLPSLVPLKPQDACEALKKIEFGSRCAVVLQKARYDEAHIGFLMWKVFRIVRKRANENKRRNAKYAEEESTVAVKKRAELGEKLTKKCGEHKDVIDALMSKILGNWHSARQQWFSKARIELMALLKKFKEALAANAEARLKNPRRGPEICMEVLVVMEMKLAKDIAELKDAVGFFQDLTSDPALGRMVNFKYNYGESFREEYRHLVKEEK